jgi:hypothetical protein
MARLFPRGVFARQRFFSVRLFDLWRPICRPLAVCQCGLGEVVVLSGAENGWSQQSQILFF